MWDTIRVTGTQHLGRIKAYVCVFKLNNNKFNKDLLKGVDQFRFLPTDVGNVNVPVLHSF